MTHKYECRAAVSGAQRDRVNGHGLPLPHTLPSAGKPDVMARAGTAF